MCCHPQRQLLPDLGQCSVRRPYMQHQLTASPDSTARQRRKKQAAREAPMTDCDEHVPTGLQEARRDKRSRPPYHPLRQQASVGTAAASPRRVPRVAMQAVRLPTESLAWSEARLPGACDGGGDQHRSWTWSKTCSRPTARPTAPNACLQAPPWRPTGAPPLCREGTAHAIPRMPSRKVTDSADVMS